ncbi:ABC transporter ATP-binding protein [Streptomyces qinzhouensis]|uniref:ABC transporter ATP-binding protein n=1 Tax=Streptomyces qinzhouensis TaxID=2599401 RepID=A0A5B8J3V4_9ACTN|nr:ABC transporter ATP-binding protein [Streptomyces qinzhouensis]QDY75957.1 ABC transporter ATP-binding protein [Streptomyces qinzhouensis]
MTEAETAAKTDAPAAAPAGAGALLAADRVSYAYRPNGRPVLDEVSLAVGPGESLAVVGESGTGKTTLLRLLLGLAAPTTGTVRFEGEELRPRDRALMRRFRAGVQCVFQDPYASLDPRRRVGDTVAEPLRSLGLANRREAVPRVAAALTAVGLPPDAAGRYPHEFSGGQRQRIAIARATVCDPRVLLADEPVSALDVTTRVKVVDLLRQLREKHGLALVMVSHDLSVVASLCDRTAVLEGGRVVESGPTEAVLGAPAHPYTARLVASVPSLARAVPAV